MKHIYFFLAVTKIQIQPFESIHFEIDKSKKKLQRKQYQNIDIHSKINFYFYENFKLTVNKTLLNKRK